MSEVTLDETQYLQEVTRGQSSSITWHEHQSGWITSSIVHEAAKASLKNPAKSLVLQITKPNFKMLNTPSLLWGREKEEIARDEYCNVISDPFYNSKCLSNIIHESFEMKDFELLVCLEKPWLGVSPDGVTYCRCCEYGALEIKCPYSLRELGLFEAIRSDTFYVKQHDEKYFLARNRKYYSQVQYGIYILDVKHCDFVV